MSDWSREEEKAFENAIAIHWAEEDSKDDDHWPKIASLVPTKTIEELKKHYQLLVEDVAAIEAGHVPIPNYIGEEASSSSSKDRHGISGVTASEKRSNCNYGSGFPGFEIEGDQAFHDITNVNGGDASAHQPPPITGQQPNSTSAMAAIGPPPPHMAGLGMYGAPVGHPVAASSHHMASAVGTPVMLPPGHHHPYVVPVAYPMAPPTMHQ
ncbi:duplicated homeodomain-like superfamily protein [Actinidia rufa]|uniref:Duplicated homeodomain-like superfamily protein n=1 Tax=Actinidia rufa TaxID=165716 RepID=A0A7J0G553_9ERIC|nr:duplicated homeodomain-like superfamily protein [Actinidia rufa]